VAVLGTPQIPPQDKWGMGATLMLRHHTFPNNTGRGDLQVFLGETERII